MVCPMQKSQWIDNLSVEDLAFIKRFILASGSLKQVAGEYGISYPTVRLRLDRLIAKIQVLDEQADAGPLERALRAVFAEGRIDAVTFKTLMTEYGKEKGEAQ